MNSARSPPQTRFSDVYAMGGTPVTAMNLMMFPSNKIPLEVLGRNFKRRFTKGHRGGGRYRWRPYHRRLSAQIRSVRNGRHSPKPDHHQRTGAAGRQARACQTHRDRRHCRGKTHRRSAPGGLPSGIGFHEAAQ